MVEKTDEDGNKSIVISSPNNFVAKNEIIAKVVNVDSSDDVVLHLDDGYNYYNIENFISIKAANGIIFDEISSVYRASQYGFVVFNRNSSQIVLHSTLQITKDKLKAYYLIYPTKFQKIPTYQEICEVLSKNRILASLDEKSIMDQMEKIDINSTRINRLVVAAGKDPVNGYNEYYIPIVEMKKKAGKMLDDGSIDYREVNSIVSIHKGEKILQKIPPVEPVDGYNIYGETAKAIIENKEGYIRAKNIIQSADELIYVSAIDGCLEIIGNKVSVSPVATVKGNVDYETGNIDFNGSVHIFDSILPGFSVKAKGDIKVENNIDDATVEAGGDVIVNSGISGKGSTIVRAMGRVKSKFILNSTIEAGDIEVEDSIINSYIFSNDKIELTHKHGKIIGGEALALHEIIVNVSGVPKENKTILAVGRSLYIDRDLMKIKERIDPLKSEIEEITEKIRTSYGEELFHNPKDFISILPPIKKKACLSLLSDLTIRNKELKELSEQYNEIEGKLKFEREPIVVIKNEVYPGTLIKIKKQVRLIDEKLENVKFYEDSENKEIRYTSAI